jgi:Putative MetA-pathway of phenol degradation
MKFLKSFAIALLLSPIIAHANCGSSFCNMNTDWDIQSVATKPGVRLDLRAEYIKQDELRRGSHKTKPAGEVDEEDEIRTINRNYLATVDWNINADWGLTFKLPFIDRAHRHIFNEDDGLGGIEPELEKWDFSGLGDIQALGRYRFYHDASSNAGVRFGLKLPTGDIRRKNSEGDEAERTLQPGTGSVDSILGAYYNHHDGNLGWFVQGAWQQTVHERDHYKPGRKLNADIGLSYSATPDLSLMLQLNAQHQSKDTGSNAVPERSGSRTVSVSPGASYRVTNNIQVYGFLQAPIYQHVRGTQLTSDWSAAVGISTQF